MSDNVFSQSNQNNEPIVNKNENTDEVRDIFDDIDDMKNFSSDNFDKSELSGLVEDSEFEASQLDNQSISKKTPFLQKILMLIMVVIIALTVGLALFWYYNSVLASRVAQEKNVKIKESTTQTETKTQDEKSASQPVQVAPALPDNNKSLPIKSEVPIAVPSIKSSPDDEILNNKIPLIDETIDTDSDGLKDVQELDYGTDKNRVDTDGDFLTDREEVLIYKTDPLDSDSDGDGYNDGVEVRNGYNPKGSGMLLPKLPNSP